MPRQFLPEKSVRATLAGIEAATIMWLATGLVATVAYAITAGEPGLGSATWSSAFGVGTRFWVLSLGGTLALDHAAITLVPLGLTVLAFPLLRGSISRAGLVSLPQGVIVALAFTLAAGLLGLTGGVPFLGRQLLGALAIAVTTVALTIPAVIPPRARAWLRDLPGEVRAGLLASKWLAGALGITGLLLVVVAVLASWGKASEINASLNAGVVSSLILGVVQLTYLPNFVVWALAWLAGPGFMVGAGTTFSPGLVVSEPLPAIPVLAALPAPGTGPGVLIILVPILIGAGFALWRSLGAIGSWRDLVIRAACNFGALFLAGLAAMLLTTGAIGPGRMAHVGVGAPLWAALALAAEVSLGYVAALAALFWMRARKAAALAEAGTAPDPDPVPDPDSDPAAEAPAAEAPADPAPDSDPAAAAPADPAPHSDTVAVSAAESAPDQADPADPTPDPTPDHS